MTIAGSIKLTADQFLALGEDPPGVRLELVDGEIYVSPTPLPSHSFIDRQLTRILLNHIVANDLGELLGDIDTKFDDNDLRRPDLVFIQKSRRNIVGENAINGIPDLCVEIISPSSVAMDQTNKFELYKRHQVPNYWIIDPRDKSIEAFICKNGEYVLAASGSNSDLVRLPPFPNLEIPLGSLWRS
jgi:Uma2 family endonuclease